MHASQSGMYRERERDTRERETKCVCERVYESVRERDTDIDRERACRREDGFLNNACQPFRNVQGEREMDIRERETKWVCVRESVCVCQRERERDRYRYR